MIFKKTFDSVLKFFILMGCCWSTSVLNSFFKEAYVWYIYIIVNSLQGFLIFITVFQQAKPNT